jgi:hypothetical protein
VRDRRDLSDVELQLVRAWRRADELQLPDGAAKGEVCGVLIPGATMEALEPRTPAVLLRAGARGRAPVVLQWRLDPTFALPGGMTIAQLASQAALSSLHAARSKHAAQHAPRFRAAPAHPAVEASPAPPASPASEAGQSMTIRIAHRRAGVRTDTRFLVAPTSRFERVFEAFAGQERSSAATCFTFKGARVGPRDTPAALGMADGAVIDSAEPRRGLAPDRLRQPQL